MLSDLSLNLISNSVRSTAVHPSKLHRRHQLSGDNFDPSLSKLQNASLQTLTRSPLTFRYSSVVFVRGLPDDPRRVRCSGAERSMSYLFCVS